MCKIYKSPYIANPNRLADLIAAIQVLGTYGFASRELSKWEARLGRKPVSADNWLTVFSQHPELFTIQEQNISLVWRRSRERNYDTHAQVVVSRDEEALLRESEAGEMRLSRPPLDTSEISQLIDMAIRLHEREIQHQQERRWWITAVIAIVGLVVSVASN
ncbi:MAG: N-carbamoyl-L-amino acid amidohydrolase [Blastocatellales bacterium]